MYMVYEYTTSVYKTVENIKVDFIGPFPDRRMYTRYDLYFY